MKKYKFGQKIKCTYHSNYARCILELITFELFCTACFNATYLFKWPFKSKEHLFGGRDWHLLFCKFGFVIQPGKCIQDKGEYTTSTMRFLKENEDNIGRHGYDLGSYNELKDSCS